MQQQRVAVVLDVGDHSLIPRGLTVHVLGQVGLFAPAALHGVEHVPADVLVLAAAQADVHPADQRGVAVGHGAELVVRLR